MRPQATEPTASCRGQDFSTAWSQPEPGRDQAGSRPRYGPGAAERARLDVTRTLANHP
ncbi:hypothetical protein [Streptomyces altiplanensis]